MHTTFLLSSLNFTSLAHANDTEQASGPVNITLEAEDYTAINNATDGVDSFSRQSRADASGGTYLQSVGSWGESWLEYQVTLPKDGVYQIDVRGTGASTSQNSFRISVDGGAQSVVQLNKDDSWGWKTIDDANSGLGPYSLSAGKHTIRVRKRERNAKIDQLRISNNEVTPIESGVVNIILEAENYTAINNATDGVDSFSRQSRADASGGTYLQSVGSWGESWLEYQVTLPKDDVYQIGVRGTGASTSQNSFRISVDGGVQSVVQLNKDDSWGWKTIDDANSGLGPYSLSAGKHTIRVRKRERNAKIDQLKISNAAGALYPAANFAAGDVPVSVAPGDLNGDGALDMAVANNVSNDVSVLLGRGDGSFQAEQRFAVGDDPSSVALGDLNSDGVLDMAVANKASADVSVLLGDGDGGFQTEQRFNAGDDPLSVKLGDLNGDGALDMTVVHSSDISVLLGNDDGSFQTERRFASGSDQVRSVALGDLDTDGVLDLAIVGRFGLFTLLGNGDGSFQAGQLLDAGLADGNITRAALALGDLNGDGALDLAVATGSALGIAGVLLGNGDGSFQATQRIVHNSIEPDSVSLGDLNGDGALDMAIIDSNTNNLSVLLGNGDGGFQAEQLFTLGDFFMSTAFGDLNGDGVLDLAVTESYAEDAFSTLEGDGVSIVLGRGDGSFQTKQHFAVGDIPRSVTLGDLNGDNVLDMAVANFSSRDVSILLGKGDGVFQTEQRFAVGDGRLSSVSLVDLNGNGVLDMAVTSADTGNMSLLLGDGDGGFQVGQRFSVGDRAGPVTFGDLNGDGAIDVTAVNSSSNDVSVLLGDGNGGFQAEQRFAAGDRPFSAALGDLDGDGVLDMAVANFDSSDVSLLLGDGDGGFQTEQRFTISDSPTSVALGDLDGDGALDMSVATASGVSALLGNDDGSFQTEQRLASSVNFNSVKLGDLNGDDILDIVGTSFRTNSLLVLLGDGGGGFQAEAQRFNAGDAPSSLTLGDLNGDGALDIAFVDRLVERATRNVSVLLNIKGSSD